MLFLVLCTGDHALVTDRLLGRTTVEHVKLSKLLLPSLRSGDPSKTVIVIGGLACYRRLQIIATLIREVSVSRAPIHLLQSFDNWHVISRWTRSLSAVSCVFRSSWHKTFCHCKLLLAIGIYFNGKESLRNCCRKPIGSVQRSAHQRKLCSATTIGICQS